MIIPLSTFDTFNMCFAMFSATRVFCHRTAFPFFILREYKINKMNHNPTHVKKSRFCTGDLPGHDRLVWVDCEVNISLHFDFKIGNI